MSPAATFSNRLKIFVLIDVRKTRRMDKKLQMKLCLIVSSPFIPPCHIVRPCHFGLRGATDFNWPGTLFRVIERIFPCHWLTVSSRGGSIRFEITSGGRSLVPSWLKSRSQCFCTGANAAGLTTGQSQQLQAARLHFVGFRVHESAISV